MVWRDPENADPNLYHEGFGNHFCSEAVPGALPKLGNNPQKCAYGLYAEQLSGTAFTVDRPHNQRTWLYRIRPSVEHDRFTKLSHPYLISDYSPSNTQDVHVTPTQLRWNPFDVPSSHSITDKSTGRNVEAVGKADGNAHDTSAGSQDFIDSLRSVSGSGQPQTKDGLAIHVYGFNKPMVRKSFYNSDGDYLILPQLGRLSIHTEFGNLLVAPGEICVISRGMKFSIPELPDGKEKGCRGYILETYCAGHWELPDLGPIGANGLANHRDFKYPVARYVDEDEEWEVVNKFMGGLFSAKQNHCPYDVVAYHGNYLPYKYSLHMFSPVGSIGFDHPDPSIFTVLTMKNHATPGTALADFVLFPPRWLVAENTFRPPWFHRNVMAEFMVNVTGEYDAKAGGFLPGGASLHNCNTAHGPDKESFEKASNADLKPMKVGDGSLAIMFETSLQLATTTWAVKESGKVQEDYNAVWQDFEPYFRSHGLPKIGVASGVEGAVKR
ncbi:hypothetical protein TWF970_005391 [Orbilia oligospora]|uniref:homogentisate 1,2-dioxygenase n=1 Tax=Orbilia oligospora TaxID=2813651 RepID=A0A7C8RIV5_ORBOL|nr:hypothetical protein TWF970_005391 [Orbilia oligospora]